MRPELFARLCKIAYDKAGIQIRPGKEALVAARVGKRLRALDLSSIEEYATILESDLQGDETVRFLDVITTNVTSFMREADHFEMLGVKLNQWYDAGQRRFRIWSAAASSGEEPYSIALIVKASRVGLSDADVRILATDISTRVLAEARAAVYPAQRLAPLSEAQRKRFFVRRGKAAAPDEQLYAVNDELKELVVLRRMNLSKTPYPMSGPLDAVFCRNVFIYFDQNIRQIVVSEISRLLKPGGLLCVGHTETLTGLRAPLRMVRPSIYTKMEG